MKPIKMSAGQFKALSLKPRKPRKKEITPRKQIEGKLQRDIGKYLRTTFTLSASPNLSYFTYSGAGERKPMRTAVLQKQKGLQKGDFDYRFEINFDNIQHNIYIEAKSEGGTLTAEQKEFMRRKEGLKNSRCYVVQSYWEFIEILKQEKILLT